MYLYGREFFDTNIFLIKKWKKNVLFENCSKIFASISDYYANNNTCYDIYKRNTIS